MAKVGAQRAAELTGKSKSTVQRAMNAGKLSFEVDANQRRLIDVSELERVFGLQPQNTSTPAASAGEGGNTAAMEIELERARHAIEIERLKMELRIAQDQRDASYQQIEDLKIQRDLWQKQAQQILITSQYSQKQSEERINELQSREEARKAQLAQRAMQQGAVNAAARTAAPRQQAPATPAAPAQHPSQPARPVQDAAVQSGPVFRTVTPGNQNRTAAAQATGAAGPKTSLFASLFGAKKKA